MGSKKNVKLPGVINVPKIGGFLPIVPILTALSALGSFSCGSASVAKTKKQCENFRRRYE